MPLTSSTAIQIAGVNVWDEGVKETWDYYGVSSATRQILCAWADRVVLINYLRGGITIASPTVIQYVPPAAYPVAPWLLIHNIQVEGLPGETGLSQDPFGTVAYKYARLQAMYQSLVIIPGTLDVSTSIEYFTPAALAGINVFKYSDMTGGDVPADQAPGAIPIFHQHLQITLVDQANIPQTQIEAAQNTTNNATFWNHAPGTVMFQGITSRQKQIAQGSIAYDVTYSFDYRSVGWNVNFDPANGWRPIEYKWNSAAPFPQYDFTTFGVPVGQGTQNINLGGL